MPLDDKQELKGQQKESADFVRPFEAVRRVNPTHAKVLEQMEQAVNQR